MRPMPAEGSGWREFAQFMSNHILPDIDRDKFLTVIDRQRMADKLREDDGPPRPRLNDLLLLALIHTLDLSEELRIYVRTLFSDRGTLTSVQRSDVQIPRSDFGQHIPVTPRVPLTFGV